MNHLPSIQTLRAFEAAYRLHNYTLAASELGLTHGAISHRIRELEQRIGATLFSRHAGRMVPTVAARQLAASIGPSLQTLEQTFATKSRPAPRCLHVSVVPGLAARWLVPRLGRFRKKNPDVALRITAESRFVDLEGGEADLAIRFGQGSWRGLIVEELVPEMLFPVCSPDYRAAMAIEAPADLARCTLLQYSWQAWASWLEAAGVDSPNVGGGPTYSEADLLLRAAEASEGVALARSLLVRDDLARGSLVRLFDVEVQDEFRYFLCRSPTSARTLEAAAFNDWLRDELRTLPP